MPQQYEACHLVSPTTLAYGRLITFDHREILRFGFLLLCVWIYTRDWYINVENKKEDLVVKKKKKFDFA